MAVFKPINKSDVEIVSTRIFKTQNLDTGSSGVTIEEFRSASLKDDNTTNPHKHYNSLFVNFYSTGSSPYDSLADTTSPGNVQHINKFYKSGSILSIPQNSFGERIKPGTLTITEKVGSACTSSTGEYAIIKDDGRGNLYSPNASISQSGVSSISSSENYIGNVFYDFGIIALTETASWSGSVGGDEKTYTDFWKENVDIEYKATQTIYVREWSVTISARDFNKTMNPTIRGFKSGSNAVTKHTDSTITYTDFTESTWRPYFNTINLYDKKTGEPLVTAKLPRPVKVRSDMNITYKLRLDM